MEIIIMFMTDNKPLNDNLYQIKCLLYIVHCKVQYNIDGSYYCMTIVIKIYKVY